jgi:hypothetical protein
MSTTTAIQGLQQTEEVWARALESADPTLLSTIIDHEFTFIGPDGQYEEREGYLAGYRALPAIGVQVELPPVEAGRVAADRPMGAIVQQE